MQEGNALVCPFPAFVVTSSLLQAVSNNREDVRNVVARRNLSASRTVSVLGDF